jgi:hypothetical protein
MRLRRGRCQDSWSEQSKRRSIYLVTRSERESVDDFVMHGQFIGRKFPLAGRANFRDVDWAIVP